MESKCFLKFFHTHNIFTKTLDFIWNRKVLGKDKNTKKNIFLMFSFTVENIKENQIFHQKITYILIC